MAGNDILSRIQILLDADTANFEQGMRSAPAVANNAFSSISDSATKMSDVVKGAIAGISFASVATFAMDAINAGNEIKKLADLSNASTQQFQYFATGAKTAGIEIDQFADQMKDMQDRIGDFQQTGGGPLADFFTGIAPLVGVTIDQFQKLSGPDAMQLFYNSLEKVFATENDIKFYMESIISDSSKLIPLLRDGGKGFDEWGAKAELAGAIMSDSLIQQMDEAKQNLQVLDLQWQGFKSTLINDAMPAITTITTNFDKIVTGAEVLSVIVGTRLVASFVASSVEAVKSANEQFIASNRTAIAATEAAQRQTGAALQVARANAAVTASTVALRQQELRSVLATPAAIQARAALRAAMVADRAAQLQSTQATMAHTAAMNAQIGTTSRLAAARSMLLGLTGGWVGLGLAVAGVAASYLLLRDNTDKATKSLNENGISIDDVILKYQELTAAQQRSQLRAETSSLTELTDKYKDSKSELIAMTLNLYRSGEASADVAKDISTLAMQYKNKEITAETLAKKINELNGVTAEGKAKVDAQTAAIKTASVEIDRQKSVVQAMIQENQKLAGSHEKVADSVGKQISEMTRLTSEQKAYVLQVQSDTVRARFIEDQIKKGVSRPRAEFQADAYSGAKVDLAKPNEVPRLVAEAEQQAWVLSQAEKAREEADKKAQEAAKKREEAAKKREDALKKASDDAIKLAEKQSNLQKSIIYDFSSASQKMYIDYVKQISDIQEANFNPSDKGQYLAAAKARYDDEILLYKMQQAYELSEHKLTDEAKAHATYLIDQQIINNRIDLNKDEKSKYLTSLDEKYAYQNRLLNLESNQRLNDASQAFQTDMQNMAAKYEFERQQIILNKSLNKSDRDMMVNASYQTQDLENEEARRQAWMNLQNAAGIDTSADQNWSQRGEAIKTALDWQLITQEEYQQKMLASESQYYRAKAMLGLDSATETLGTMTSLFGSLFGEQSKAYAAMFALEKGFAVAKAMMAIPESYSKAYNAVVGIPYVGPYLAPVMGGAAAAAQVAQAAMIKNVNLTGMAHNGIDNIPKEGTWLLDKGERVLNPSQNRDLTNYLSQVQTGGQNRPIDNKLSVIMVKDEDEAKNYKYSKDFEDAVLYHMKRNRSKI